VSEPASLSYEDEDGTVVRNADSVAPGSDLEVRLAKGTLLVTAG
jgi:hypothetical protein